jgi:hypothetical protein
MLRLFLSLGVLSCVWNSIAPPPLPSEPPPASSDPALLAPAITIPEQPPPPPTVSESAPEPGSTTESEPERKLPETDLPPSRSTHSSPSQPQRQPKRQPQGLIGSSTRKGFILLSVGSTRGLRNPEHGYSSITSSQLEQAIGSRTAHGLGFALVTQQTLSSDTNYYAFAGRIQYDAEIGTGLGLYLTPLLTVGYRRYRRACPPTLYDLCLSGVSHQATVQLGLEAKLVAANRLILSFRPVTLEIVAPALTVNWQLVGGLGLTF